MASIVILVGCILFAVYLVIATTVLRLTTRMVAGITPTFGSATGTIFATILLTTVVWCIGYALHVGAGEFRLPAAVFSIFLQSMVYAVTIKDNNGAGISFGQALLVIIFQIPVAILLGAVVVFAFAGGGLTLASLVPHTPRPMVNMVAASQHTNARWATLAVPVSMPTKYGNVSFAVGSPVEIIGVTSTGYRARINGTEMALTKEQVRFAPQ